MGKEKHVKFTAPAPAPAERPENEHIFPATHLTKLALQWQEKNRQKCEIESALLKTLGISQSRYKDLSEGERRDLLMERVAEAAKRDRNASVSSQLTNMQRYEAEAMAILEPIVIGSTEMFQRLAQHEGFHHTVDLPVLTSAAQEKVVKWLLRWLPAKGTLFAWFSKCAKNAFRSEIVKVNQFRNRFYVTGDNLEKFFGADDPDISKEKAADKVRRNVRDLSARWGDPQELGALQFLIECVLEEDHDKQAAIKGASYAWCITADQSKFFYNWVLVAMREQFYEQIHVPFTMQDLFRHANSYTHIVDLLNVITWEQMQKLIMTRGGMRFKIPTVAQMAKLHEDYKVYREIDQTDKDPDSVAEVAEKHKKSPKTAQEIYEDMTSVVNVNRSGEYSIFDSENS